MKQKAKPESKIPTTQKNTNQKKKTAKADSLDVDGSLLKKNEFTLIIAGALVVTVIVFFLFFRSSGPGSDSIGGGSGNTEIKVGAGTAQGLEKRVAELEVALARLASSASDADDAASTGKGLTAVEERVNRLETAVTLKMDAMIERMAGLEKKMASISKRTPPPRPVAKASPPAASKKAPVKKKTVQSKKTVQVKKQTSLFHTVKKGETLWSISQKYNTTVQAVRKLNNLTPQDKIYPGNNILVR